MPSQAQTAPEALLVEDEALLALAMPDLLTAEGFTISVAFTEMDAHAMAVGDLSVAIVNLNLAGNLAGQHIIRRLRQRIPNLPVVVVTGYDHDAPQADLRGLGGPTMRLRKPEHYAALATSVRDVMDAARRDTMPTERRRQTDRS